MSLYIDYRPTDWDQVFGNAGAVSALQAIFAKGKPPSAFLLHGPSGCGKTTIARIIASKVGCEGQDLWEVNVGNNRGIDTAREIISTISLRPMFSKARVILLDEVHASTKDFQGALLKPLEDTPPGVYFVLCTTNPEGIIPTIKNRCSHFKVEPLSDTEMSDLIKGVVDAEGKELAASVVGEIVAAAEGSPRKALVILEQVIDLPEGEQSASVQAAGGDSAQTIELCRALINGKKWQTITPILKGLEDDPERIRRAVLGYFNSVLLGSYGKKADQAALIIEIFKDSFFYTGKAGLTRACYLATVEG